jgi:hypothetical protein
MEQENTDEEIELEAEVAIEEAIEVMAFEHHDLMPSLVEELEGTEIVEEMVNDTDLEEEFQEEMEEEEEEQEEQFILNMEADKEIIVSEFVLSKPTNIYAEEENSIDKELHTPAHASTEIILESNESDPSLEMEEDFVLEEINIHEDVYEEDVMEEELIEEEMMMDHMVEEEIAPNEIHHEPLVETPALAEVVFETSFRYEEEPSMQLVMREESNAPVAQVNQQANYDMPLDNAEEQRKKVAERIQKLRSLSFNINNANDPNNDFESVPAYVRRNMEMFGNTLASVENYYSKYTVDKDENNQTQISTINTFMDGKKPD